MKLQLLTLALLACTSSAFVPISAPTTTVTTSLQASSNNNSRRDVLEQAVGVLATGAMSLVVAPAMSLADARPMYLTEPTEEFKANEAKAAEFRRLQLVQKKKFLDVLDKLTNEKDDEAALEEDLITLRKLVVETQGLPAGIKKEDFYKQIRTKKARGFWPTKVEIA